jgi:hypothetical protein
MLEEVRTENGIPFLLSFDFLLSLFESSAKPGSGQV